MVQAAVRFLLMRRGAARPAQARRSGASPRSGSGYIVLAMGKMGAFELNYSSDIDLIVFFDPDAPAMPKDTDPSALYIRVTRGLVKLLQERTGDGYVFRVDLRLRPDPASTQIAISVPAALDYYEHRGQNWERSAMIKARPCAGDIAAGEKLLKALSPFVWRKYMDFAALADIHAMKRQIHAYRGHGEIAVAGHNIKLGRGGIREIEFFVQTQQLIAGGRHPELRDRRTLTTLVGARRRAVGRARRRGASWRRPICSCGGSSTGCRWSPTSRPTPCRRMTRTLDRFAKFLGFDGCRGLRRDAGRCICATCSGIIRNCSSRWRRRPDRALQFPERRGRPRDARPARRHGLSQSAGNLRDRARLARAAAISRLRSEFARTQLAQLIPLSARTSGAQREPRTGGARPSTVSSPGCMPAGGARLISLLLQNPDLLALVALMLGTAPRLADILAHQPQAMDALLDPAFFGAAAGCGKCCRRN